MDDTDYLTDLQGWRQKLDTNLRTEVGWLSLAGLFWLEQGENSFGSDLSRNVVLPKGTAPKLVGSFVLEGGIVTVKSLPDAHLTADGQDVGELELQPDVSGSPTELEIQDLVMIVVQRGERLGIRLWDKNNPKLAAFKGRNWYTPKAAFRFQAQLLAYEPPKIIPISDILGDTHDAPHPGKVSFSLEGEEYSLDAGEGSNGGFFITFKDKTSQQSTYPSGRYLITSAPQNGIVDLDFNRAYNPPCAFTEFATCPLPPPQNILPFEIPAGELYTSVEE